MITKDQIIEGAKFKHLGDIWTVDKVYPSLGTILVETSVVGEQKGNYRDSLEDLVEYLNETKSEVLNGEQNGN